MIAKHTITETKMYIHILRFRSSGNEGGRSGGGRGMHEEKEEWEGNLWQYVTSQVEPGMGINRERIMLKDRRVDLLSRYILPS